MFFQHFNQSLDLSRDSGIYVNIHPHHCEVDLEKETVWKKKSNSKNPQINALKSLVGVSARKRFSHATG